MKVSDLPELLQGELVTPAATGEREIKCGYSCDLLSWVMAHGREGMAWVTVQTHMNVVAVAVLAEMACVILPEGVEMAEENVQKAGSEGLAVVRSPLSAYEICGRLHAAHVAD